MQMSRRAIATFGEAQSGDLEMMSVKTGVADEVPRC